MTRKQLTALVPGAFIVVHNPKASEALVRKGDLYAVCLWGGFDTFHSAYAKSLVVDNRTDAERTYRWNNGGVTPPFESYWQVLATDKEIHWLTAKDALELVSIQSQHGPMNLALRNKIRKYLLKQPH